MVNMSSTLNIWLLLPCWFGMPVLPGVIPSRYRIPAQRPESLSPCAMMAARVMPASDKSVSETVRRTS